ncbi:MAG: prolipoprotein diacylglyceryl transferase, partial [bacterium]|nr:prolipoprotein diacylglyceryl transferase [bacterium]
MRPILFSIGSFQVPSFFFFIMVGVLACTSYCYTLCRREGLKPEAALDFGILGMLSGVLGARIFHILVEAPDYYWEVPSRVFEFWKGGFVSWGAFLCVPLSLVLYIKIRRLPFWSYIDMVATALPLVKFFVRVACLFTGCCYGRPTEWWWGIRFTHPESTAYYFYPNIPLHPVQILSIIQATLLFFAMRWIYKRRKFPGETAVWMVLLWVVPRFFIEFLRGDTDRGIWFGGTLATGQVMG